MSCRLEEVTRQLTEAEKVGKDDKKRSARRHKHYILTLDVEIKDDAYTWAIEIGVIIFTNYPNNDTSMALQRSVADFARDLYHQTRNDQNTGDFEGSRLALEDLQQLYKLLNDASENFLEGIRVNKIVRLLWGNRSLLSTRMVMLEFARQCFLGRTIHGG